MEGCRKTHHQRMRNRVLHLGDGGLGQARLFRQLFRVPNSRRGVPIHGDADPHPYEARPKESHPRRRLVAATGDDLLQQFRRHWLL